MDGLSGMKVYQSFLIDTDFLPSNYPESLEFLIKGIIHKVENNQWTTRIESMAIPKNPFGLKIENSSTEENIVNVVGSNTSNPSNITVPPPINSNPSLLIKAVTDQANYIYTARGGELVGQCGNYSYNIAYKIKEHIDTRSSTAITYTGNNGAANQRSEGNADTDQHRNAIKRLGIYDEYYLGTYTPNELKQWISSRNFNYGDILNYYAPGHTRKPNGKLTNAHTQIYTGTIFATGMDQYGNINTKPNSGWSTSTKTNYGAKFVYNNDLVFKVYYYQVNDIYQRQQ